MLDSKEIRRQNLRALIAEQGTAASLAEKAQTSAAYISQILSQKTKAFVGDALARKLESATKKPRGWMDTLHYEISEAQPRGPQQSQREYAGEGSLSGRVLRNVPIAGVVEEGPEGYLDETVYSSGCGAGYVEFPAKDRQTYALRVRGDSMRPRIKSGESIIIEPNVAAHSGDDVVVTYADGRRMVKELLYIRDGEITFGSVNDASRPTTIPLTQIEAIHYIAAIVPRGAVANGEG